MDRGAWEAIVHGVAKSQTRLSIHALFTPRAKWGWAWRCEDGDNEKGQARWSAAYSGSPPAPSNHRACPISTFLTPQHLYLLNCYLSSHHTTTGRPGRCGMFPTLPEFGAGPGPWLVLSKCPIREDDL